MATSGRSRARTLALIVALAAARAVALGPGEGRMPGIVAGRPGESIGPTVAVRTVEAIRAPDGIGDADVVTFDEGLATALVKVAGWI
jgi:hypothetical protein